LEEALQKADCRGLERMIPKTKPEDLAKAVRIISEWFEEQASKSDEDASHWDPVIRARALDCRYRRLAALEQTDTLLKIAYDGATSLLLEVQQECIELRKENERIHEALGKLISACDAGQIKENGIGGMTIEAQIKRSTINGVSAWAVEEARQILEGTKDD
jgi:hypothetical protein